jgi:hypothetical protein
MDTDAGLAQLNVALELQLRSLLQFTQGDPTTQIGELSWTPDPAQALDRLMEHVIMRKQNQIDWLRRARRQP